jgi:hypothetical protein
MASNLASLDSYTHLNALVQWPGFNSRVKLRSSIRYFLSLAANTASAFFPCHTIAILVVPHFSLPCLFIPSFFRPLPYPYLASFKPYIPLE